MNQVVFLCLICSGVQSEKILAVFFFPSISHQNVLRPIAEELSLRGHEVTLVTPNPGNDTFLSNLTEIDISVGYEAIQRLDGTKFNRNGVSFMKLMLRVDQFYHDILSRQLESKGVSELLKKPADSFDLILIEGNTAAYFGLQHKFKVPLITISSYGTTSCYHYLFGNSIHPVLHPDVFSELIGPITNILDRLDSFYFTVTYLLINRFYYFPNIDKLVRPYFGRDMPYIEDLVRNASLMMLNVNPIISERRPLPPNVVPYYNLHLTKKNVLPRVSIVKHGEIICRADWPWSTGTPPLPDVSSLTARDIFSGGECFDVQNYVEALATTLEQLSISCSRVVAKYTTTSTHSPPLKMSLAVRDETSGRGGVPVDHGQSSRKIISPCFTMNYVSKIL